MKNSENPCKPDCPKRSWDCHTKCPEYKDYAEKVKAENERISKIKKELALQRSEEIKRKAIKK